MEIDSRVGNVVNTYELIYDEEKVKELMDKIATHCSFKQSGEHVEMLKVVSRLKAYETLKYDMFNEAGNKLYENIDENSIDFRVYPNYEHGDSYEVHFKATKNVLPILYMALKGILDGYQKSYMILYNYFNSIEWASYEEREAALLGRLKDNTNDMEMMNVYTIKNLDDIINEMKKLLKEKEDNKGFDFDKLRDYYFEACKLFSLKLKRKTEVFENGEEIKPFTKH